MRADESKIKHLLSRNVVDVIDRGHLEKALSGTKKLRIKHGVDPTGDKIHIGRAVVLWKLKEFQDLGHKIVLIIGDYTAQIGDPSDKLEKRPFLSPVQIKKNLKNYLPQISKVLDIKKCEVRYNSEWLGKLKFQKISELAEQFTMQQMLKRRNFSERLQKDQEISLRETFYPLMQGYDSVAVKADVELGGTDQLFNLLAGRKIQERYKQKPQDVVTTGMLSGLDGRKMSTSWGNVLNITDSADEQYGKAMSMHDSQIPEYLELATDISEKETGELKRALTTKSTNPKEIKMRVAFEIVKRYYGEKAAQGAQAKFQSVFAGKEIPEDAPVLNIKSKNLSTLELVVLSGVTVSKSDARRIIEQGGLKIDNATKKNPNESLSLRGGEMVKIGKKRFFKIK